MRGPQEFEDHPYDFPEDRTFRGFCTYVVDGDTFDVFVDLGFFQYHYTTIRLRGVDTPEIFRPKDEAEKERGFEAKRFVEDRILNRQVLLRTRKDRSTFGRFVAGVWFMDPERGEWVDLSRALRAAGFAKGEG